MNKFIAYGGNYRNFKLAVYFIAQGTQAATREKLEQDLAFFAKHMRLDKVYLEPYRSLMADEAQVELSKAVFASHGMTDGRWERYRMDLMRRISEEVMIDPARRANPNVSMTIKYPNWAEAYQETGYNPKAQRKLFNNLYTGTETRDPSPPTSTCPVTSAIPS